MYKPELETKDEAASSSDLQLQPNLDITKSSRSRDRFVISSHGEAYGGYIRNPKLGRYISNFVILRFRLYQYYRRHLHDTLPSTVLLRQMLRFDTVEIEIPGGRGRHTSEGSLQLRSSLHDCRTNQVFLIS